ncbi:hypothetical protein HK099_007724 [Clydaea vesicula]|uniref:Uncharacterized protein n=1 Tax=Clydaea vesicula TaxID=447962 RepID=A0AAD5TW33_9FUNG|nr:hypothetical protein HK099_007724 [Clydaea vesicula]
MEPFIIIAIFSLLAVFIIRKFVKDKKRTNQVFDTSLPSNAAISLNERSLYYYQEEFGNEQLPKYGGDLEFQPSSENIPLQILNSEFIDTTATPEQSNLLKIRDSFCELAEKIHDDTTLPTFCIVGYSFGTIITADLLTIFHRHPESLVEDFNFTRKAMDLLANNLRLIVTMGCPYSWFFPERPVPLTIFSPNKKFEWINLYFDQDFLATPLKVLDPIFKDVTDIEIDDWAKKNSNSYSYSNRNLILTLMSWSPIQMVLKKTLIAHCLYLVEQPTFSIIVNKIKSVVNLEIEQCPPENKNLHINLFEKSTWANLFCNAMMLPTKISRGSLYNVSLAIKKAQSFFLKKNLLDLNHTINEVEGKVSNDQNNHTSLKNIKKIQTSKRKPSTNPPFVHFSPTHSESSVIFDNHSSKICSANEKKKEKIVNISKIKASTNSNQDKIEVKFHSAPPKNLKKEKLTILLFLHGMADEVRYKNESFDVEKSVKEFLEPRLNIGNNVQLVSVYYPFNITKQQEDIFLNVEKEIKERNNKEKNFFGKFINGFSSKTWFSFFRKFILTHYSVAMGYLTCHGNRVKVHKRLDETILEIVKKFELEDSVHKADLVVLGNSLGMTYLGDPYKKPIQNDGVSMHIDPWQYLNIEVLITLGSPMHWFIDPRSIPFEFPSSAPNSRNASYASLNELLINSISESYNKIGRLASFTKLYLLQPNIVLDSQPAVEEFETNSSEDEEEDDGIWLKTSAKKNDNKQHPNTLKKEKNFFDTATDVDSVNPFDSAIAINDLPSFKKPNWFNIYYPSDICAGPLKNLTPSLKKAVTEDFPIPARGWKNIFGYSVYSNPLVEKVETVMGGLILK